MKRQRVRLGGLLVLLAVVSVGASWAGAEMVTLRLGQAPKGPPAAKVRVPRGQPPTAYVPRTDEAPKLDGKLDEAIWKQAVVLRLARTLDGGGRAAQPTTVRLLRDDKMLYGAVQAFEPLMSKLQATRRGHDGGVWGDDSIEIFLGTGGAYWHFGINALGSTYDGRAKDASWNSGFQAAAARAKTGYTLEVAIPLVRMAGKGKLPTDWIANFNRNRRVTGSLQEAAWSPTYSGDSHVPSRFGRLLFKQPPKPEPGKEPETPVLRKKDMEILPASNGPGVVRFGLSRLPRPTKVHRADLLIFRTTRLDGRLDEAMVDIEIQPLFATFRPGGAASAKGKPLAIRGPWHDRFDATEAVKSWVSGKTNGGFFVKACPFWSAEATCLDVWYQGKPPPDVPPQVAGVEALHHAGQTFVTWKEIDDPVAAEQVKWGRLKMILDNLDRPGRTRYCVYRHNRKITAGNIHRAELIATVKPLSCWNINGRNIDRPVDEYIATADGIMTGHWNPFGNASLDGQFGRDCPIDRLVIPASPAGGRGGLLPSGTGLYVHTPDGKGKAYYAVVTCRDGVQNTRDISGSNSLGKPVAEQAGEGEPVLQRELPKMPFFNYEQKRLQYVRWVAPPYVNAPSQYYNWSVGVPDQLGKKVPLELNFHRDGHSYWRTHYRIERDSIVLCPHDFPIKTWWFGYHESLGTLKSFAHGTIQPYTERRLLAFVEWASKTWPVDRNRILVTGCRGGASGSGALHLGLRHADVFNLVISGHGAINYAAEAQRTDRWGLAAAMSMQAIWGKPDWNIKTTGDQSFWEAHNMLRLLKALPVKADLPFLTLTSAWESAHPFYEAMLSAHRGVIANFSWGGARYVPVSAGGTYPNAIHLDLRRDRSYPAIAYVTGMKGIGNNSALNTQFRWRDIVDGADRYEVTLSGDSRLVVVALRRVRKFCVEPGRRYAWENKLLPGAEIRRPRQVKPNTLAAGGQSGEVTAAANGLLVINGVETAPPGSRLVIRPM